jgi:hypothetical protein
MNSPSARRHDTTNDIYVTTLLPASRWIASAVAVVMTSLTLAVVSLPIRAPQTAWVGGIHVTDLAPVAVSPSRAELSAAGVLEHAAVGAAAISESAHAAQLGAQLAMPYYSFGTASNKE